MAVSTLHHHFRALTAMLMDGLDANAAAFEVGYESASQFNREYNQFFDQPPIRDVRMMRQSLAHRDVVAS